MENNNIRFVFNTKQNSFKEFEGIFHDLHHLQRVHELYLEEKYSIYRKVPDFRIKQDNYAVYYISKRSPFDIGICVQQHWRDFIIIATFLANYVRLKESTKELNRDANYLIDKTEAYLKVIVKDFPEFEREIIADFIEWFLSKKEEQKAWIVSRYRYIMESISKITDIFPDKNRE